MERMLRAQEVASVRFSFVDRVLEQSEDRLVCVRALSSGEEYLQDHFEGFPVMPGVLMLESMTQACRLLLRKRDERFGAWVLGGARGVRYSSMVRPGQVLRVEVRLKEMGADSAEFQGSGVVLDPGASDGSQAVVGKLTLREARMGGVRLDPSGVGEAAGSR